MRLAGLALGLTPLLPPAPVALAPSGQEAAVEAARAWRETHGVEILEEFAGLLAVPSVAADRAGLARCAALLAEAFTRRGATMELVEREGAAPLVIGRIDAPGATRTLGLYVHYDGQPVSPEDWTDPPFEPTLRDAPVEQGGARLSLSALAPESPGARRAWPAEWRLYARGAGDDKAPLIALLAALDALAAADLAPTSSFVFAFEGEEEAGSTHLRELFEAAKPALACDLWLVCDGPVHQSRRPQLVFGVRGVTSLELTTYGAARPLHSGHYGNWAPNPALELARLLASMKDARGRVLVEGYYDTVQPLGAAERAALAALPEFEQALRAELGLAQSEGEGASLAERIALPSLNIRGLRSADVGAAARNIIPASATAALDLRLVRGNDPARMQERVVAHVRAQGWKVIETEPDLATRRAHPRLLRVQRGQGYRAVRTPLDHPLVPALSSAALAAAGEAPLLVPSLGGSLPLYLFEDVLGTPMVIVPIANHDDNQHAADENLRLANLAYGIDLFAALLRL